MGFGLVTYNSSGGLTLSSDGRTYGYIGRATWVSTSQPPTGLSIGENGHSTYTISWAGDIVVALPIKTNGGTALIGKSQAGSTWTITVHKGTGSLNSMGFDVEEATEVYVFGAPVSAPAYGLVLYNSASVLAADMTRRPLTFDKYLSFAASTSTAAFSGLTTPAVIGIDPWEELTNLAFDATFYDNRTYHGAWKMGAGVLQRTTFQTYFESSPDQQGASNVVPATNAILIEASGL